MTAKVRRGQSLGDMVLVECLGKGGNSEVWRGSRTDDSDVAVKVLTRPGTEAKGRFRREVDHQTGPLSGLPGLLPVLSAADPTDDPQWLAMPVAEPLDDLSKQLSVEEIVEAMAQIARALEALVIMGYAHRDVKPGNLFRYQGAYVVGDLGLIATPEPSDLTLPNKQLGPLNFLAPEMVTNPSQAEPPPADVYSFGKTIWVIASGQRLPLPGPHTLSERGMRLTGMYLQPPLAPLLDHLIERMTRLEPRDRISMGQVADELERLASPRETVDVVAPDLEDLRIALAAAHAPAKAAAVARAHREAAAAQLFDYFVERCSALTDIFSKLDPEHEATGSYSDSRVIVDKCNTWSLPEQELIDGVAITYALRYNTGFRGENRNARYILWSGCGIKSMPDGDAILIVGHVIGQQVGKEHTYSHSHWKENARVMVGSQLARDTADELAQQLIDALPDALASIVKSRDRDAYQ